MSVIKCDGGVTSASAGIGQPLSQIPSAQHGSNDDRRVGAMMMATCSDDVMCGERGVSAGECILLERGYFSSACKLFPVPEKGKYKRKINK